VLHDPPQGIRVKGLADELHICFPYHGPQFLDQVRLYEELFQPHRTVIHSSVPVGTCRKLGVNHSPIRGTHPHLARGIQSFVKYIAGPEAEDIARAFQVVGVTTYIMPNTETTELLKLMDTTQYGMMILVNRWCAEQAKKHGVELADVYTHANQTYNEGYAKLGRPEVARPWLSYMPGPIGGHCVRENARLIDETIASMFDASR
jgi:UDP-N-acetyl-D-mannosaminuronate dehydrogenase